jgi:hypothetical protein
MIDEPDEEKAAEEASVYGTTVEGLQAAQQRMHEKMQEILAGYEIAGNEIPTGTPIYVNKIGQVVPFTDEMLNPPKYPPNLKRRWKWRFRLSHAWWVITHFWEYRIVHKDRVDQWEDW